MAISMADLSERIERLEAREHALRLALRFTIKVMGESEDTTLPAFQAALRTAEASARKMNAPSETIACLKEIADGISS